MRKYFFMLALCLQFAVIGFSQIMDQIALRKIDSLKKMLPSTKGIARVDMLNNIARGLLWIWESNDQYFYDALNFSDEALKLAKNLKYKRGIGYAMVHLFWRETQQIDTNRVENYKPGSQFQKSNYY